ncbi:MAG: excinuclease ABC subunit C [Bacteroidales bacterium]|nr:excinuclease ABC subunit C [Bacteroidales bacterium]
MLLKDDKQRLSNTLKILPECPGVYQYFDEEGTVIYVGKAKVLKRRVSQYFDKDISGKTKVLVSKIADVKTIVVNSEVDALLLENNLIKKYQPRYNIRLKDDKSYPWICIRKEPFPRVVKTRNKSEDGSEYFGPYASVRVLRTVLDLITKVYPLRSCSSNLSAENIRKKKVKLCLKYHIGKCKGPCQGLQSEEEYNNTIANVRHIISGNISVVLKDLETRMFEYSDTMQYEQAQEMKEKIDLIRNYQSKSTVLSAKMHNYDVFSIATDNKISFINYIKIVEGAVVQVHTIEMKKVLDETDDDMLLMTIADMREKHHSTATEIIVPFEPSIEIPGAKYIVPKAGDKKQLLNLSERNLKYYIMDRQKKLDLVDPDRHKTRILNQMKEDLRMSVEPHRIECFDNSNLQGTNPVASMSCFIDCKPAKKEYRHFNIKTVVGADDFASMREIITRRYTRVLNENLEMPDLIVIDGGKGQLSAALESLDELGLRGKVAIIGIAKRLEEIYFPGDQYPLYLSKDSETLKIIQQIRDEAHRFGITHHRNRRSKRQLK